MKKSEFALLQTSSRLLQFVYFVKCWHMFWSLKDWIKVQKRKRKLLSCIPVLDNVNLGAFTL